MAVKLKPGAGQKFRGRVFGIILALVVIGVVTAVSIYSSAEMRKTIPVVRVKSGASISANALITEDMLESYDMYYKEFQNYGTLKFSDGSTRSTIVRWGDKDHVVGKRYAAYYLRGGTVLFWDSTLKEQVRKNSYLYNITGELLNIKMTTVKDFGDMVVPGDTLNIRASYKKKVYNLPSEMEYRLSMDLGGGANVGVDVDRTSLVFSEATVLDMLNSSGASIFDLYYKFIAASKQEQAALLSDKAFLDSVRPVSILLEVTAEEVENYTEMQQLGAQYQITLLPRTTSSAITDSLSKIQDALAGIADKK